MNGMFTVEHSQNKAKWGKMWVVAGNMVFTAQAIFNLSSWQGGWTLHPLRSKRLNLLPCFPPEVVQVVRQEVPNHKVGMMEHEFQGKVPKWCCFCHLGWNNHTTQSKQKHTDTLELHETREVMNQTPATLLSYLFGRCCHPNAALRRSQARTTPQSHQK